MKINWKNLIVSIIISLVVSSIVYLYLEANTYQDSFLMAGIVEEVLGGQTYMPYEQIYLISFVCFVVVTIVTYIVRELLQKRKK